MPRTRPATAAGSTGHWTLQREMLQVNQPRRLRRRVRRVVAREMCVAVEERGQVEHRVRRRDRKAPAAARSSPATQRLRDGFAPSVIQAAMSGRSERQRPRYLVAAARPAAAPAHANVDRAFAFVRAQRQQKRQRDEERHRHVGQDVVRLAHVQRHHRHQPRGEQRVARAPAHPDVVARADRRACRRAP